MFKPMLAVDAILPKVRYPVYASPKLDGLRCTVIESEAKTRSLKPFPNKMVNRLLSNTLLNQLDGELIVGSPTAHNVIQQCTSHLMSKDKQFNFQFFVFDFVHTVRDTPFRERLATLDRYFDKNGPDGFMLGEGLAPLDWDSPTCIASEKPVVIVRQLEQVLIHDEDELLAYEERQLEKGYEGIIIRDPEGVYKYGRSTAKEGLLMKVKRFKDSEAEIIDFMEQNFNGNEAMLNELGRMKRSKEKAGMKGKDTLGSLVVRDIHTGVQFNIGTGMDDELRWRIWHNRDKHRGRLVKYKFFPVGVKDLPRHPVFIDFRDPRDMS